MCGLEEEGRGGSSFRAGSRPPSPACRGGFCFVCVWAHAALSADMLRAVLVPAPARGLLLPVSERVREAGPLRKAERGKPGGCCGLGAGGTGAGGSVVSGVRGSGPPGARRSRALAALGSVPPQPTAPEHGARSCPAPSAPRRLLRQGKLFNYFPLCCLSFCNESKTSAGCAFLFRAAPGCVCSRRRVRCGR